MALVILIAVILLIFLSLFSFIIKRYKRCPSDRILVIYGKVGGKDKEASRCIHGGAAFIWPVIQDYQFLDLTPIPIEVDLQNALSRQNIRVNVPSRFMVGISKEEGIMQNAAERLLGLTQQEIHHLAADIIFGQLRVVIATMNIEEINADREKFLTNVSASVEHELRKIGLNLINVNVTDITDSAGYIEALGKEATSQAVNDAKRMVAEKNRDGEIGRAEAEREQRIKVAEANSVAEIGEAEATRNMRIKIASANSEASIGEADATQKQRVSVSAANAKAVEGENTAKISVANSDADRRKREAEAQKIAVTAEKVNDAQAKAESYSAEKEAELKRAERETASRQANIIVPAEIDKRKIEIDAEAEAEKIRRIAKGDADATFVKMEAEAKGIYEILSKQAEGFKMLVQSADNSRDAVLMMIADKLPELVKTQVEAIKNIKIDKITVWDNSGNGSNGTSTANFMKGMMGAVPPLEDLFKLAGMELPSYLKGKSTINDEDAVIVKEEKKGKS
jgi:flotillin